MAGTTTLTATEAPTISVKVNVILGWQPPEYVAPATPAINVAAGQMLNNIIAGESENARVTEDHIVASEASALVPQEGVAEVARATGNGNASEDVRHPKSKPERSLAL